MKPREAGKLQLLGRSRATSGVAKEAHYTYTGLVTGEIPTINQFLRTIEARSVIDQTSIKGFRYTSFISELACYKSQHQYDRVREIHQQSFPSRSRVLVRLFESLSCGLSSFTKKQSSSKVCRLAYLCSFTPWPTKVLMDWQTLKSSSVDKKKHCFPTSVNLLILSAPTKQFSELPLLELRLHFLGPEKIAQEGL